MAAAPGMTFGEVVAASTVDLDPPSDHPNGWWLAQPAGKHQTRLAHPTLGFELPPSLFSLLEASEQRVRRVRSTPQLGYVTLSGACKLVDALHETFVAAGWEARVRYGPERLEWMARRENQIRAGLWKPMPDIREKVEPSASWRIDVELRKTIEAGTAEAAKLKLEADAYLVTVVVVDEAHPP